MATRETPTYQKMNANKFPHDSIIMFDHLSQCLEDWEQVLPRPKYSGLVEQWKNEMKQYLASSYQIEDVNNYDEHDLVECISTGLITAYLEWEDNTFDEPVSHEATHALMMRPQTVQRTLDWYNEFKLRLTASEIYKVFGPVLERGKLVMQKAGKLEMPARNGPAVAIRSKMSPFDWGICLEPVVKQVLEERWKAMIHECGRFIHQTETRLAASPDGLIIRSKVYPEMAGHLLEIKCPKSRKIGVKIPIEYYYQMQLQMEVTAVRACEYVEVQFEFVDDESKIGDLSHGRVAVIGCFNEERGDWVPSKYLYGPTGDLQWKPELGLNEQTLEINTWVLLGLHHERVVRDEGWFQSLMPKLDEFWADIEKAKVGEFKMPESSRKKKETVCLIVD
jgi:YqaJ-like viral recombinase domain